VEEFNKKCKESVWEYVDLWQRFTERIGYWVDTEKPYVTYHNLYIDSLWNILKTVNDKNLLYKDYRVVPWCPRCGTALSSHELAQEYHDDKDLTVTAKFEVVIEGQTKGLNLPGGDKKTFLLAWTTTPWTLPGNVALAVNPDIKYGVYEGKDEAYIVAIDRANECGLSKDAGYELKESWPGSQLRGIKYKPLYDFLANKFYDKDPDAFEKSYKVYGASFVNVEDGTGIVHTAVMYGQEDFVLGTQIGLPKHHLVKDDGNFLDEMDFLSGRFVKDEEVAVGIIKDLAHRGLLFKKEKYEHSYPHCWRCKTPLIYYARDSWYIKMSSLRDKLVDENEKINWEPSYIKEGRFGEWLKEVKDWAISRERYWGTPLPVWINEEGGMKVIGGIDDLKKNLKSNKNKFFVMRHGQAQCNVTEEIVLKNDRESSLTEKGIEQVKESAEKFQNEFTEKIDAVYCSPYERSKQTAKIMCEKLGFDFRKVVFDERIHEWEISTEFEGKDRKIMQEYYDGEYLNTPKKEFSDGESFSDVVRRAGEFMYEIDSKHKGQNILVVSHSGTARALAFVATGKAFEELKYNSSGLEPLWNAEIRELDFVPLPHNDSYELDLHRPYIDQVELVDENGKAYRRVREVMDVWFDSGAMPFAQDNYPFATKEIKFPADYISEAIDQTRGWFYTLHAVGVLMDKGHAYNNVICLGHILDAQGKKMSKSLGNIVDPWEQMDKYGVDALRVWMFSVNQPGDSKNYDEKTVDEIVKKVFNPLENIVALYEMYKDENVEASDDSQNVLDRWIISKLNELITNGSKNMDSYKVFEATRLIKDFVNDFSTWYVRRSRERLKSDDRKERNEALKTTKFVLLNLVKYMAPFTPFFSERMYKRLKSEVGPESVHLTKWPEAKEVDAEVVSQMTLVREVVTKALELRQKSGHKVRQPLQSLSIPTELQKEYLEIIADEVNVKEVKVEGKEIKLDTNLTEELKKEGIARDIIRGIQDARKKEGLNPSQNISVFLNCSEEIRNVVSELETMIKSPTQTERIEFSGDVQKYEFEVGEAKVSVTIKF
jgi:isoleucyl-tRNA synthetase